MLYNYFKIALRNLLKRKSYTIINLFGLTVGLTACLIIFLFVQRELSYDQFHSKSDRIFRIGRQATFGGQTSSHVAINYSFADYLNENLPGFKATRLATTRGLLSNSDRSRQFQDQVIHLVEPSFFEIFDVTFLSGSSKTSLDAPNKAVVTRTAAIKYFGAQDPVGQVISLDLDREFVITGVVEDWPKTSHFNFDFLVSLSSTRGWYGESMFTHWGNMWAYTYVLTDRPMQDTEVTTAASSMAYEFGPPALEQFEAKFFAQRLEDIHLESHFGGEIAENGSKTFVQVFIAVGVLILLIACFNFINLATARASWRAKEIGLRKVVGAGKRQLVSQFLGESILLTFVSMVLAIILVIPGIELINSATGLTISADEIFNPLLLGFVLVVMIVVGLLAGTFPAFYLSAFQPLQVLRGNSNIGDTRLAGGLRRALVTIQFIISICLVAGGLTINSQLNFIRNMELGFENEQVVVVDLYNKSIRENMEVVKSGFRSISSVQSVGGASDSPPTGLNSWWVKDMTNPEAKNELISIIAVDYDFVKTMGFSLSEGRDFDATYGSDGEGAILLNQSAVDYLGLSDPINTKLDLQEGTKEVSVVGVLDDFHFASVHQEIQPVMMHIWPGWVDKLFVKVSPGESISTIDQMSEVWNELLPGWEFSYHFMDQDFAAAYQAEEQFGQLILVFSTLALIIGILGLFGLASYVAEQKTKEIGIRKVLGAAMKSVIWIQYRTFLIPLGIALLVAAPIAYYMLGTWLDQFAYRVNMSWWLFASGGILTLGVSIATVSVQAFKAAMGNPIDALRSE